MKQTKEKSETYKRFYELFLSGNGEGSAVISDKQVVLIQKSLMHNDAARSHFDLTNYISNKINMSTNRNMYNEKNSHFFFGANQFHIVLPESGESHIGLPQYKFINDILDAYEDALKTNHSNPTLLLSGEGFMEQDNIAKMREKLKEKLHVHMFPQKQTIYEKQRNK